MGCVSSKESNAPQRWSHQLGFHIDFMDDDGKWYPAYIVESYDMLKVAIGSREFPLLEIKNQPRFAHRGTQTNELYRTSKDQQPQGFRLYWTYHDDQWKLIRLVMVGEYTHYGQFIQDLKTDVIHRNWDDVDYSDQNEFISISANSPLVPIGYEPFEQSPAFRNHLEVLSIYTNLSIQEGVMLNNEMMEAKCLKCSLFYDTHGSFWSRDWKSFRDMEAIELGYDVLPYSKEEQDIISVYQSIDSRNIRRKEEELKRQEEQRKKEQELKRQEEQQKEFEEQELKRQEEGQDGNFGISSVLTSILSQSILKPTANFTWSLWKKINDKRNASIGNENNTQIHDQRQSDSGARITCCVCFENDITTICVPCNHACVCKECGVPLKTCPICRTDIMHLSDIFICYHS